MDLNQQVMDATALLERIVENRRLLAELDPELRKRFLIAAGRASKPDTAARRELNRERRRRTKVEKRDADRALRDRAGIRRLRENPIFQTPRQLAKHAAQTGAAELTTGEAAVDSPVDTTVEAAVDATVEASPPSEVRPSLGRVEEERVCYVCRARYTEIHWFYDQLCLSCGDFNYQKRSPVADLGGRVAMVTGSRVKIGYQAAIMLLRAGAKVLCVTRFPVDAATRYAAEPDFSQWGHRLEVHGVDLRHTPSVEALCEQVCSTHDRLDFLINNACQTVRRPPGFYAHMMDQELSASPPAHAQALVASQRSAESHAHAHAHSSAQLSQVPLLAEDLLDPRALFPADRLDADLQQVDLRDVNSWRLKLDEVPTIELLEVHLVNAVAPFVLNARLKPLMQAVPSADKHIVNVSAMEGQFYRTRKSDKHPHTNMAKAALNMMTRTSAVDYVADGIHMNSVDTGWVTDEDPVEQAQMKREMHNFHPPLDIVDGAARIVDPIFHGLSSGEHVWGQFLKDYQITDW